MVQLNRLHYFNCALRDSRLKIGLRLENAMKLKAASYEVRLRNKDDLKNCFALCHWHPILIYI